MGEERADLVRHGPRPGEVGAGQQGCEFFAADAADETGRRQVVMREMREGHEQPVARGMAVAVVDELEPVEVHQQQGGGAAGAAAGVEQRHARAVEGAAVTDAGERILQGFPAMLLRGALAAHADRRDRDRDGDRHGLDPEHPAPDLRHVGPPGGEPEGGPQQGAEREEAAMCGEEPGRVAPRLQPVPAAAVLEGGGEAVGGHDGRGQADAQALRRVEQRGGEQPGQGPGRHGLEGGGATVEAPRRAPQEAVGQHQGGVAEDAYRGVDVGRGGQQHGEAGGEAQVARARPAQQPAAPLPAARREQHRRAENGQHHDRQREQRDRGRMPLPDEFRGGTLRDAGSTVRLAAG